MARGRMISKSLSTSEKRARLHQVAGRLAEFCQSIYPLIVAHADDWGRLDGSTFHVKYAVDPASPRSEADFGKALTHLAAVELLEWYEVDGRKYIQVSDFDRHQTGLHKRKDASSRRFPENPGSSAPNEQNVTEQKRTETKGTEQATPDDLMALWNDGTTAPIPKCSKLSDSRRKHAAARLGERDLAEYAIVIGRIDASDFCRGAGRDGWIADFDWFVRPDTAIKVLEGKYDNRQPKPIAVARQAPVHDLSWQDECREMHDSRCTNRSFHEAIRDSKAASRRTAT